MKDLKIFRQHFSDVYVSKCEIMLEGIEGRDDIIANNRGASMYILYGGFSQPDPQQYLDEAVREFVEGEVYNEFVESSMDNPWYRIIIFGVNNIIA